MASSSSSSSSSPSSFSTQFTKPIRLDVGGVRFSTTLETLRKDPNSLLAAMFSGNLPPPPSPDGSYFIDRDGVYFGVVLNFLRTGLLLLADESPSVVRIVLIEAEYYKIAELVRLLKELPQPPEPLPPGPLFIGSTILPEGQLEFHALLNSWAKKAKDQKWNLLFKAKGFGYGFGADKFHQYCDNKGATYTIVKSGENIFGGFNAVSWNKEINGYSAAQGSFLFSLINQHGKGPTQCLSRTPGGGYEIEHRAGNGPTFGGGPDLLIANNGNIGTPCSSRLPTNYLDPHNVGVRFFAGAGSFRIEDYEVFNTL